MINEDISEKIRKRLHSKRIRYIENKDIYIFKEKVRYIKKRTRNITLNMLSPKDFNEWFIFNYADLQYIKRCEWWHFNNQDIKYIIKTNPIKPEKLEIKQIKRALQLIQNGEKITIISKRYQVSPAYFYYYFKNETDKRI